MTDFNTVINAPFAFYRYWPSLVAAIIFTVLFILTTGVHLAQLIRNRTWYFIPLFIGGCLECIGYIARAMSSKQTPDWTLGPFIVQAILLLVAPALFAATIYMSLGRIILSVDGEKVSLIRKRWLTKLFVAGDVFSFLLQASGGGIMAGKTVKAVSLGQNVILGGLFLQLIFFGLFIAVSAVFQIRLQKRPTPLAMSLDNPWRQRMAVLYLASALIMIRSIFRVIEYLQGNAGYILRHEIFLYLFDAVLMLGVMVLLNIKHPGRIAAMSSRKNGSDSGLPMA